jgi:hypothetical protein
MDSKLAKTLAAPDYDSWRQTLWNEISSQAIGEGWVLASELTADGRSIDHESDKWAPMWAHLVEIRYLFRPPVSRCVHARFLHSPKDARRVGVGYLSFHTSPYPAAEVKALFERRRSMSFSFTALQSHFLCVVLLPFLSFVRMWRVLTMDFFIAELMEWRASGGTPPRSCPRELKQRSPKSH